MLHYEDVFCGGGGKSFKGKEGVYSGAVVVGSE